MPTHKDKISYKYSNTFNYMMSTRNDVTSMLNIENKFRHSTFISNPDIPDVFKIKFISRAPDGFSILWVIEIYDRINLQCRNKLIKDGITCR